MKRAISLTIIFIGLFFWNLPGASYEDSLAIKLLRDLSHKSGKLGTFRALIIGIDDYNDDAIPDLKTPIKDAFAMDKVLREKYGFKTELLLGRKATRAAIYHAMRNLVNSSKPGDSVLIYYAGHGDFDRICNDGWWIPADAEGGKPTTYLDNTMVQKAMLSMDAPEKSRAGMIITVSKILSQKVA